jgi:hypothetical protein
VVGESISRRHNEGVKHVVEIVAGVIILVPALLVLAVFIAAAKKDGEEDRALQRRLGIRRRTRLGR